MLFLVSLCPLVPCGNHAQLMGGNDAERLRSTLAYGWVERCNEIVSFGEPSFEDKYLLYQYLHLYSLNEI